MVIYDIITGERPSRPLGPDGQLSDDIWRLISNCWSPSWNERPSVNVALNALKDAADAYATTNDQRERMTVASRRCTTNKDRQSPAADTLPPRSDSTGEEVEGRPPVPQNTQSILGPVRQPSQTPAFPETPAASLEFWEVDLAAFLDASKIGTEFRSEGNKAQEFVEKLDAVRHSGKRVCLIPDCVSRFLTGKISRKENESSI